MREEMDGMTNKEMYEAFTEIKVGIATLTGQMNQIVDMKSTVEATSKIADEANNRSKQNEKDITAIQNKEKDWKKILPGWVAVAIAAVALLLPLIK